MDKNLDNHSDHIHLLCNQNCNNIQRLNHVDLVIHSLNSTGCSLNLLPLLPILKHAVLMFLITKLFVIIHISK